MRGGRAGADAGTGAVATLKTAGFEKYNLVEFTSVDVSKVSI